ADDSVALSDSASAQPRGHRTDLASQLTPGDLDAVAVLGDGDDRWLVDQLVVECGPQGMLGVVDAGAGEPLGTGHGPARQHVGVGLIGDDVEEVPDRAPEAVQIADRPAP